jgi:hypothetical protein
MLGDDWMILDGSIETKKGASDAKWMFRTNSWNKVEWLKQSVYVVENWLFCRQKHCIG